MHYNTSGKERPCRERPYEPFRSFHIRMTHARSVLLTASNLLPSPSLSNPVPCPLHLALKFLHLFFRASLGGFYSSNPSRRMSTSLRLKGGSTKGSL